MVKLRVLRTLIPKKNIAFINIFVIYAHFLDLIRLQLLLKQWLIDWFIYENTGIRPWVFISKFRVLRTFSPFLGADKKWPLEWIFYFVFYARSEQIIYSIISCFTHILRTILSTLFNERCSNLLNYQRNNQSLVFRIILKISCFAHIFSIFCSNKKKRLGINSPFSCFTHALSK